MAETITLTQELECLKPGESRVFRDAKPATLRRLVQRLQDREPDQRFMCRSIPDGYQVWRTA